MELKRLSLEPRAGAVALSVGLLRCEGGTARLRLCVGDEGRALEFELAEGQEVLVFTRESE
jgi:hypothetical protein